jgi:DNA-binding transcriptional LysR family regulator
MGGVYESIFCRWRGSWGDVLMSPLITAVAAGQAHRCEQLNAGRLDVVFAKRPLGTSKGRMVWREPLVWAAADTFDLVPGAAVPLALYRERSVSREAALAALDDNELTWEIIYTSPSLTGVRAAALAGLAITPLPASALIAGLRILASEAGLPPLPDLEFAIYEKPRARQGRRGTGRGSADPCTGTIAPGDLKMKPGLLHGNAQRAR